MWARRARKTVVKWNNPKDKQQLNYKGSHKTEKELRNRKPVKGFKQQSDVIHFVLKGDHSANILNSGLEDRKAEGNS